MKKNTKKSFLEYCTFHQIQPTYVCVTAAQWCAVNSVMFVLVNNVLQQLDLYFTTGYLNLTTFGTGRPSWDRSATDPIPKRAWKGGNQNFLSFTKTYKTFNVCIMYAF